MKISWVKYKNDKKSFKIPESLGFDVFKLQDLDEIDNKLRSLINDKYNTIIISDEVASFSEDLIKKYMRR